MGGEGTIEDVGDDGVSRRSALKKSAGAAAGVAAAWSAPQIHGLAFSPSVAHAAGGSTCTPRPANAPAAGLNVTISATVGTTGCSGLTTPGIPPSVGLTTPGIPPSVGLTTPGIPPSVGLVTNTLVVPPTPGLPPLTVPPTPGLPPLTVPITPGLPPLTIPLAGSCQWDSTPVALSLPAIPEQDVNGDCLCEVPATDNVAGSVNGQVTNLLTGGTTLSGVPVGWTCVFQDYPVGMANMVDPDTSGSFTSCGPQAGNFTTNTGGAPHCSLDADSDGIITTTARWVCTA